MQGFFNLKRIDPRKRGVVERIKDFSEIYTKYTTEEASPQANRCVQCGDPYCLNKCPLGNYIPQWLKKISEKDLELAFNISNESSPFPEIMGRVCPQDRLCEGDCTLNDGYGAITIGAIEVYISERGFEEEFSPKFPSKLSNKKVAVIGSGPSGLSVATFLLRAGIRVEMFERSDRAGGLLTYGIPGFKLEKSVVERRVDSLTKAGMKLHLNKEIGKDIEFKKLQKEFDAIYLGIGATKQNSAGILNEKANGCYAAMEFLVNIQRKIFGLENKQNIDVKDKRVVVIGGGDTAMDCVRTSIREGAKSVKILYRRDEENMPGSKKEVRNAKEEGVEFVFQVSPKAVSVDEEGVVIGVECENTTLGERDESGREACEVVPNTEHLVDADIVIFSLGFSLEHPSFFEEAGIKVDKKGRAILDENYESSCLNVFAGGDCFRGADLVVTAALDGREAAKKIIERLA